MEIHQDNINSGFILSMKKLELHNGISVFQRSATTVVLKAKIQQDLTNTLVLVILLLSMEIHQENIPSGLLIHLKMKVDGILKLNILMMFAHTINK